jgi:hypothetical protein
LANQNFRVKNGLEVGTGVTISGGIVTATTFSGNATSSNYATTAGITTYSSISGISTSVIGGIGNISQLQVSGVSTFQSSVFLGDGDVLYFGDGEDLLIWHNSNDSIIRDSGTGDLLIEGGNRIKLTNPTGIETYAVFNQDGAVELYYDNVKKFETTGAGVTITGTTFTNQLNVSGVSTASSFVKSGGTSSQFLKADGSVDSSTYLTTYTETDTLNSVTNRGNNTSNGISVGIVTASSFVKSGGTSSQFLKADGSVDSSTYLTSYTETDTLNSVTNRGNSTSNGISVGIVTATTVNDSIGNVRDVPQNSQISAYILTLTDVGKHISITTGGVTVNSGIFSAGDAVSIYNNSGGNQTITQGTSVTMYLAGTATTGNRTLAQRGICTVLCVASNTFVIFGAGLT